MKMKMKINAVITTLDWTREVILLIRGFNWNE
jgi:hypothetical protein